MKKIYAIAAMEARSVDEIPEGFQWQHEPNGMASAAFSRAMVGK
jgi:hypothetical protein